MELVFKQVHGAHIFKEQREHEIYIKGVILGRTFYTNKHICEAHLKIKMNFVQFK